MIPKTIHYCWFGRNPLPPLALKCIESWKKYLPDYEIIEWNEDNFDINIVPYTSEAYKAKKYAFVSDYARFWILYQYGGLYFDTDVEIIKPIYDIIDKGAFMGCENDIQENPEDIGVNPGLCLGATSGLELYKEILDYYSTLHFIKADGSYNLETVVNYTTNILLKHGLINTNEIQQCAGIWIYPKEYFCPIDYDTKITNITLNTRSIHHYTSSWLGPKEKLYNFVAKYCGKRFAKRCSSTIKSLLHK